jgi:hypothetical protein
MRTKSPSLLFSREFSTFEDTPVKEKRHVLNFSGLTRYFEYDISFTRCQQVKPWRNWQGTGTTTKIKFLLW